MEHISTAVDNDRFAEHTGMKLVEVSKGYAKAKMEIQKMHLNGLDMTHGGVIFTLADLAFAAACNSHGIDAVAININISYLKPARLGQILTAEAIEISLSRKLGTYNISVFNENGQQIAAMQGTAFRRTPG